MQGKNVCALNADDWYVLQVRTNREYYIKDIAGRLLSNTVRLIVFSREIIHKKSGDDICLVTPLFPGYIFVQKEINTVTRILQSRLYNEFIHPVRFNSQPAKVSTKEMEWLLHNSDHNGKIELSCGYARGESVEITSGPLKNIPGKILFINKKKCKAKVRFTLFHREMDVSLGLDFINRAESHYGVNVSAG